MTADTNEDLPPLKKRTWLDYHPSQTEWKLIKLINHCLKVRQALYSQTRSYFFNS